jgi:hypothetical protein
VLRENAICLCKVRGLRRAAACPTMREKMELSSFVRQWWSQMERRVEPMSWSLVNCVVCLSLSEILWSLRRDRIVVLFQMVVVL